MIPDGKAKQNLAPTLLSLNLQTQVYASSAQAIYNSQTLKGDIKENSHRSTASRLMFHVTIPHTTVNLKVPAQTAAPEFSSISPFNLNYQVTPKQVLDGYPQQLVFKENLTKQTTTQTNNAPQAFQGSVKTQPFKPMTSASTIDVGELAEKIFHLIERKSRIERERRGCWR
jgi:hypothetical protein